MGKRRYRRKLKKKNFDPFFHERVFRKRIISRYYKDGNDLYFSATMMNTKKGEYSLIPRKVLLETPKEPVNSLTILDMLRKIKEQYGIPEGRTLPLYRLIPIDIPKPDRSHLIRTLIQDFNADYRLRCDPRLRNLLSKQFDSMTDLIIHQKEITMKSAE